MSRQVDASILEGLQGAHAGSMLALVLAVCQTGRATDIPGCLIDGAACAAPVPIPIHVLCRDKWFSMLVIAMTL